MRRLRRHLFAVVSATSLLLVVLATIALGVGELKLWDHGGTRVFLLARDRNSVAVVWARAFDVDALSPVQRDALHHALHQHKWFGFWFVHGDAGVWGLAAGPVDALKAADHVVSLAMPTVVGIPALLIVPIGFALTRRTS